MKANNGKYWWIAAIVGTLINAGLFSILPRLGYTDPPPPAPVIKLDFYAWQKPITQKAKPKKAPPPKPKPKPQPKPKPKPKPSEPKKIPPKPVEKPVLTEKETKPEPEPKPIEEIVEPEPEPEPLPEQEVTEQTDEDVLPTPAPIFEVTTLPRFIHMVQPVYPPDMRAQNKEAKVKVEALIDSKGVVRQVRVIKSAGESFDKAAVEAIKNSTFTPGDINGKPVAVLYRIPVAFKIR